MSLTNQIFCYSVDTDGFYYDDERLIHDTLNALYLERYEYKKLIEKNIEVDNNKSLIKEINLVISENKNKLKELLSSNMGKVRTLHNSYVSEKNVISVFESTFTRTVGISTNQLTDEIIVVHAYYFDVVEDIIKNGFMLNGEKYRYFVSSAGQIRTKKSTYIKESTWEKNKLSLMCGITFDDINSLGGINSNKFMAYLALSNSATDVWEGFDIDRAIVVKDLDMMINGTVDFIDEKTYGIEINKVMDVPITVTDGCGIMLPSISTKSRMIRLSWMKGLLVPFDFLQFIKINKEKYPNCHLVKDIYGDVHDVISEDISIIFTESQFKLYKYYKNWEDYKTKYKENNCIAGYCNEEPDNIKNAKLNYQMLQTLYDLSDDEISSLVKDTQEKINNIGTSVDTMLQTLGVTKYNTNKNYFQESLLIYPELLRDKYTKDMISQAKMSILKNAKGGKINISGKYTFIIPDLYSFAEYLFLGIESPKGILENGEISCKLYPTSERLTVLRSPHLYIEYCIKKNTINDETKKWFITNGIYMSSHDLMSKIIMNDWDGDQCLVCDDQTLISVGGRVSRNVVPIFYDMHKAKSEELNLESMYKGLLSAYSSGSIGIYSNSISKVWNKITEENFNESILAIKYLCMESNFNIDQAKTLYMPVRPSNINEMIKKVVKGKVPNFFIYAKDKDKSQVELSNKSSMNRISSSIKNKRIDFSIDGLKNFDYKMLMKNKDVEIEKKIVDRYIEIMKNKKVYLSYNDRSEMNNHAFMTAIFRAEMFSMNYTNSHIVDVLVRYLYEKGDKNKSILWNAFGDIVLENLKNNKSCGVCGIRIESTTSNNIYCQDCAKIIKREQVRIATQKYRNRKMV